MGFVGQLVSCPPRRFRFGMCRPSGLRASALFFARLLQGAWGRALFRSSQLRWQLQAGPITCLPDLYDPALVEKGNKLRYDAMHFTMRHGNFTGGHWFGFV